MQAFQTLTAKVDIRKLSIAQRVKLLSDGLADRIGALLLSEVLV